MLFYVRIITQLKLKLYHVSKNVPPIWLAIVPPMACYNFDTHKQILIFFGRNVADKVGNQEML